jgi:hypothetical protein
VNKSDLDNRFEERCIRQLDELPQGWCPAAVMRLKYLKSLGREPTEEDEKNAPGCPWAVSDQLSGYCWFVYEAKYLPEQPLSDQDIAANLNISVEAVKETSDRAIKKIQNNENIKEIRQTYDKDFVIDDSSSNDESIYIDT